MIGRAQMLLKCSLQDKINRELAEFYSATLGYSRSFPVTRLVRLLSIQKRCSGSQSPDCAWIGLGLYRERSIENLMLDRRRALRYGR
jgi:hypothetical protein